MDITTEVKSEDYTIALNLFKTLTVCRYYSSSQPLNPSSDYEYANNPGIRSCSSSSRKSFAPSHQNPLICEIPSDIMCGCIFYAPDFKIIKKIKASNSITYYYTRFRNESEAYCYKLYDANSLVFLELNYVDIKSDNNIDQEACRVFDDFVLNELFLTFENDSIADDCLEKQVQKTTNSFFKVVLT